MSEFTCPMCRSESFLPLVPCPCECGRWVCRGCAGTVRRNMSTTERAAAADPVHDPYADTAAVRDAIARGVIDP